MRAGGCAAAAVADAVRARAVPRHPNEERPVVAVVGRPPVLRPRHQRLEVLLQCIEVKCLELLSVVELLTHRIGRGGVLVKHLQVQLIRPPMLVRHGATCVRSDHHWAFAFAIHVLSNRVLPLSFCIQGSRISRERTLTDLRFTCAATTAPKHGGGRTTEKAGRTI